MSWKSCLSGSPQIRICQMQMLYLCCLSYALQNFFSFLKSRTYVVNNLRTIKWTYRKYSYCKNISSKRKAKFMKPCTFLIIRKVQTKLEHKEKRNICWIEMKACRFIDSKGYLNNKWFIAISLEMKDDSRDEVVTCINRIFITLFLFSWLFCLSIHLIFLMHLKSAGINN